MPFPSRSLSSGSRPRSSDPNKALNLALRYLTAREYSYHELVTKLCARFTEEVAQAAAQHCREQGWQSDERYADMLCRHMLLQGYGPLKLKFEGVKRGLDAALIAECIERTDWTACALEYLQRHCADPAVLDYAQKHKLLARLSRRGFSGSQCLQALNLLCAES